MNIKNKKGQPMWVVISGILIVITIAIVISLIFDIGGKEEIDRTICRNDVVLRANIPEPELIGISLLDFKEKFPLRCQAEKHIINYKDTEKAGKEIVIRQAECWHLMGGKEDFTIFPSQETAGFITELNSYCVPCSRTEFSPEVITYYDQNPIDLQKALLQTLEGRQEKAIDYLAGAFSHAIAAEWILFDTEETQRAFNIEGTEIKVDNSNIQGIYDGTITRLTGGIAEITLPRYLTGSKGDLVILYAQNTFREKAQGDKEQSFGHGNMLIYYQIGQEDATEQLNKIYAKVKVRDATLCDYYEGIFT